MRRAWSLSTGVPAYVLLLALLIGVGAAAQDKGGATATALQPLQTSEVTLWTPQLILPNDSTLNLCTSGEFCFPVSGYDPDPNDTLTLSLLRGPIPPFTRTFTGAQLPTFNTTVCFTPALSGDYWFVFRLRDRAGRTTTDSVKYVVILNHLPVIEDQFFSEEQCYTFLTRMITVTASDADQDQLRFRLLAGPGSIGLFSGEITYQPAAEGVQVFQVEVSDACGADTAQVADTISLNQPPYMIEADTTVRLCAPGQVCVDLRAVDPEDNLIDFIKVIGDGTFTPTGPGTGRLCFTPTTADSAQYVFVFCLRDGCIPFTESADPDWPGCVDDTLTVTVVKNHAPSLICPGEQVFASCVTDTFCFGYQYGDEDGDPVTVRVLSGNAYLQNNQVCVIGSQSEAFSVVLEAADLCGLTDTCVIPVRFDGNQPPQIQLADDFSVELCAPEQICFGVTTVDPDADPLTVTPSLGTYDPQSRTICFTAETAGTYVIAATASDPCGAIATDSIIITVGLTTPPGVRFAKSADTLDCFSGQVCYDVAITGNDIRTITTTLGTLNVLAGTVCYIPEVSGVDTIIVVATDACERTVADTLVVHVALGRRPMIGPLTDAELYLCRPETVCIPAIVSDPDGDLKSVTVSRGTWANNQICFVPYDSGVYRFILTAVDSCNLVSVDTVQVRIRTDQEVVIGGPGNVSLFLCQPQELCFPITGVPDDATVRVIGTGVRWNATTKSVCFTSDCCLENNITVEVTTRCGTVKRYSFTVTINTNSRPIVLLPRDTSLNLCGPTQFCFPVAISDAERNISTVQVTGASYDAYRNRGCLQVDTAGVYVVNALVTDSCGLSRSDQMVVTASINRPPTVTLLPYDNTIERCDLGSVCVPISVTDPDQDVVTVTTSAGTYDPGSGQVCFDLTQEGLTCVDITVTDPCGATATVQACVTLTLGGSVDIVCPTTTPSLQFCGRSQVCLPLSISGSWTSLTTSLGSWRDGQLCFDADTSGFYQIQVIATAGCNADTCAVGADILITDSVAVICPANDTTVILCAATDTITVPIEITGSPETTTLSPSDAWIAEGFLYVPVSGNGQVDVSVLVENPCNSATCSFRITTIVNTPPVFVLLNDTTVASCGPVPEIRIPLQVTDAQNNLVSVVPSQGVIVNNELILTPSAPGTFEIQVTALDECGFEVRETVVVQYNLLPQVALQCPPSVIPVAVDLPGEVRVPLTVTPPGTPVVVSPNGSYDAVTNEVVVSVTTIGQHVFTVSAEGPCNMAQCTFTLDVRQYVPPLVSCAGAINQLVCEVPFPNQFCYDVTIGGEVTSVIVEPAGAYADGQVCIPVTGAGTYDTRIIASDGVSADTCTTTVTLRGGDAPSVNVQAVTPGTLCPGTQVCVPVTAADADGDLATIIGTPFPYDPATGQICFNADTSGSYQVTVTVTDSCGLQDTDTELIAVTVSPAPVVEFDAGAPQFACIGQRVCVPVTITDDNLVNVIVPPGVTLENGQVCFIAMTEGTVSIEIVAVDACGNTGRDQIQVSVALNDPPHVDLFRDTTIFLCAPQTVCIPLQYSDPDNNVTQVTLNRGAYQNNSVCFVPYDSGTYRIIATVLDACGATAVDTALVRIVTEQGVSITGPGNQSLFLCEPDTLCFPINGIPEGALVRVIGTNVWWNDALDQVCFYSDCCLRNDITVEVTTTCGRNLRYSFSVTVRTNSAPIVRLPRDTTLTQCTLSQICVPVGYSDADNNITSVETSGGIFDGQRRTLCFTPDGPGTYTLSATVTDACGKVSTDQMVVTIVTNEPPAITVQSIPPVSTCVLSEVCMPLDITDANGNLQSVSVTGQPGARYDAINKTVCFTPSAAGQNCVTVTATDSCGLQAVAQACVEVTLDGTVDIACLVNSQPIISICDPGQVCVPVTITGQITAVTASFGSVADGQLCFSADTSGTYRIRVIATAQCNADTCDLVIPVQIAPPVALTCPNSVAEFLCSADTLCYEFTVSPLGTPVRVLGGGYVQNGQVCVPVLSPGNQSITLIAETACHADTCSFTVTSTFNVPPVVSAGSDRSEIQCTLAEICLPFTVFDANNNLATVTATAPAIIRGQQICITPASFGTHPVIITATDACGAIDVDTALVTVTKGDVATISCPAPELFMSLCQPGQVCVSVPVTPLNAAIRVTGGTYNANNRTVCVNATVAGSYPVRVIADALCGSDTCDFTVQVTIRQKPDVQCPPAIDTLLCLSQPRNFCFPVTIVGTTDSVRVSQGGSYSAGVACIPVSAAGNYPVRVIAYGPCGADTCATAVTVRSNQAPVLTVPSEVLTFERCPDDGTTICIPGIKAHDNDGQVSISLTCGPGQFGPLNADSGAVCFVPNQFGAYEFCLEATDGCHVVKDTLRVMIHEKADCDLCVKVSLDAGVCTPVGLQKSVKVMVETNEAIGGFDLLLTYDASAIALQGANIAGTSIDGWEYFRYTLRSGACGSSCPPGLVRLVGLADINNGAHHPPSGTLSPDGVLVNMVFLVANNQNLGGQFVPINFIWYDCADNSFSDTTGTKLFIDKRVLSYEDLILWDEDDNVNYPENLRLQGVGAPDTCIKGDAKSQPVRCVEFKNGGICVIHPDEIDDRGDINLDGVSYTVADAVMFTRYFIVGIGAFTPAGNIDGSIAASDCNADGITLSVADLTFLIRVIIGDINPIPKQSPYIEPLTLNSRMENGSLRVGTQAVSTIGTAWLVYALPQGATVSEPRLTEATRDMEVIYSVERDTLRVLVYDIGQDHVTAGAHDMLDIPISGGEPNLVRAEIVDYVGRSYRVVTGAGALPSGYRLDQNYPNPFNPSTHVDFALPTAGDWSLRIYTVTGSLVREFVGQDNAGTVQVIWDGTDRDGRPAASGVYFYRLDAGSFSATRKMMLIK